MGANETMLVIDTSYGSTVGITGHEPLTETDSRTHVEKLQVNIATAVQQAKLTPNNITTIVAGIGPAPFTGLRAGIVAAKALAFATGAKLVGQDILAPQAWWNAERRGETDADTRVLTLAVNDARRKQLYFELCAPVSGENPDPEPLIAMDIDYPAGIVTRVNEAVNAYEASTGKRVLVDVVGHGATKYASVLQGIDSLGDVVDESVLDQGAHGLDIFIDINELDRELVVRSIATLERELFGKGAWSESAVRQELDAPARFYFADVAEADGGAEGRPVIRGYAGFWYDGDDAEIMTIGVGRDYQRHGIAAALLQRLIDEARTQGAARMLLEVRVDNDPALALYERFGFQRLGLRKRYYQPEGIDAYTMSLDVAGPRIVGFQSGHTAA